MKDPLTTDSLKGMQSVRATFNLPVSSIELLDAVAIQLGLKKKSIFDYLVKNQAVLEKIAKEAQKTGNRPKKRRQKTFVLSRSSLLSIEAVAGTNDIPRDLLVEYSIKRLLPVIEAEKKRHINRKNLLKDMQRYLKTGEKLLEKAGRLVGKEDQVYQKLSQVINSYAVSLEEFKDIIEKGRMMENLD